MLSLIISIIALGLIVTFHEFGHFIVARAFKVGVVEFSLGMGPRIASLVKGGTRYSIRAVPFGGSCLMLGEEMDESEAADAGGSGINYGAVTNGTLNKSDIYVSDENILVDGRLYGKDEQFVSKKAWQRFLIIAAGPVFNFILAFVFALIITLNYGYDRPVVMSAEPGMPAAEAGLSEGDTITGFRMMDEPGVSDTGRYFSVDTSRDIQLFMIVNERAIADGQDIAVRFKDASDGNTEKTSVMKAQYDEASGRYVIGISYNAGYGKAETIGEVLYFSLYDVRYCIRASVLSIKMIAEGSVNRADVMGPVRMVATMDETVETASGYGVVTAVMTLLNIMVLISGSLGAMNLLPLPALDGGRLVFIAIEIILRKPVPKNVEAMIHMAGMLLLLLLMVFILFNDVSLLIN